MGNFDARNQFRSPFLSEIDLLFVILWQIATELQIFVKIQDGRRQPYWYGNFMKISFWVYFRKKQSESFVIGDENQCELCSLEKLPSVIILRMGPEWGTTSIWKLAVCGNFQVRSHAHDDTFWKLKSCSFQKCLHH